MTTHYDREPPAAPVWEGRGVQGEDLNPERRRIDALAEEYTRAPTRRHRRPHDEMEGFHSFTWALRNLAEANEALEFLRTTGVTPTRPSHHRP